MTSDVRIRTAEPGDAALIRDVVSEAFASAAHGELVDALCSSPDHAPELCVVAEVDGAVVGYVMISVATLVNDDLCQRIANLSPVAVLPSQQSRGIGSALMRDVTTRADNLGEPAVVLEGDPQYYKRFGFEPAAEYGIELPLPAWAPPEAAQVLRLKAYEPSLRGRVEYPAAFDLFTHD